MAKDVDLSSKEWTDLIFEGKNKAFGAYTLRRASDKRHNKAMLLVIIGLIVVLIGGYFWGMYSDFRREQRELELQAQLEQQLAEMAAAEEQEEQVEEEIPQAMEEPQAEEALPEEILNTIGIEPTVAQLDLTAEDARVTFRATKDIRDKYVLSRLAWDLGVLDELCALL